MGAITFFEPKALGLVIEKPGAGCENGFYRYTYCLNNPLIYTDPSGEFIFTLLAAVTGQWWALPITIGADFGAVTGGIRGAQNPDIGFWGGAARGALVGGVGGGLSVIGGAGMPFITNLALGTQGLLQVVWTLFDFGIR